MDARRGRRDATEEWSGVGMGLVDMDDEIEPADTAGRPPRRGSRLEPALIRVEEAARLLSLGRSKTYALVASGELPAVRIGRSVRIPLDNLRRWVQDQVE